MGTGENAEWEEQCHHFQLVSAFLLQYVEGITPFVFNHLFFLVIFFLYLPVVAVWVISLFFLVVFKIFSLSLMFCKFVIYCLVYLIVFISLRYLCMFEMGCLLSDSFWVETILSLICCFLLQASSTIFPHTPPIVVLLQLTPHNSLRSSPRTKSFHDAHTLLVCGDAEHVSNMFKEAVHSFPHSWPWVWISVLSSPQEVSSNHCLFPSHTSWVEQWNSSPSPWLQAVKSARFLSYCLTWTPLILLYSLVVQLLGSVGLWLNSTHQFAFLFHCLQINIYLFLKIDICFGFIFASFTWTIMYLEQSVPACEHTETPQPDIFLYMFLCGSASPF